MKLRLIITCDNGECPSNLYRAGIPLTLMVYTVLVISVIGHAYSENYGSSITFSVGYRQVWKPICIRREVY